jgi:hypothetical protein
LLALRYFVVLLFVISSIDFEPVVLYAVLIL